MELTADEKSVSFTSESEQCVKISSADTLNRFTALPGPSTFTPGDNHPTLECLRTPKNKAGQIKDSDLVDPLSPPLSPSKTPEEMSERRRSGSVFRRCAKAVSLFLCRGEEHTQQPSQGSGLKGHSAAIKYTVPEETSLPHKGDCEVDLSASDRGGKIFSSLMSCFGFWRPHGSGDFGEVYEENHKKVEQFFWPQSASSEEIFQPRSDATSFLYESLLSSL
ncbi:hypothetical protein DNTS_009245 [Danionella cerebrum]|uniref:Uncharacterized protein n=1 Tax=Danionella cerebrum TaxID=2873325 RepID=A0A553Q5I1_9TELE|nr:hypothetical protein DNTS_009245 [Danionella translucida]